jgi:DNA-binding GntR family transcriptional regulator
VIAANDRLEPATEPFSVSAAAKRFSVSRIHIRRMLDAAERAGLIVYTDGRAVVVSPQARDIIRRFYAEQLMALVAAAGAVRDALPQLLTGIEQVE